MYGWIMIHPFYLFDQWINESLRSNEDIRNNFEWEVVRSWMHWSAVYVLPTIELVEFIKSEVIKGHSLNDVIEVASGAGRLGRALGIRMTNSQAQSILPHTTNPLLQLPHKSFSVDIITRSNPSLNRIWVWYN